MKARHVFVLVVLGGLLSVLAVFLVIAVIEGDDSARGGAGMHQVDSAPMVR